MNKLLTKKVVNKVEYSRVNIFHKEKRSFANFYGNINLKVFLKLKLYVESPKNMFSKCAVRICSTGFRTVQINLILQVIVPLVSFPFSVKFMKGVCLTKCIVTLIKFSLNISVDFDKDSALNIAFFLW